MANLDDDELDSSAAEWSEDGEVNIDEHFDWSDENSNGNANSDLHTTHSVLGNYPSLPLNTNDDEFRLLRILPSHEPSSPINCSLSIHHLANAPAYDALSYTWGKRTRDEKIVVNGRPFLVTNNAADAIRRLRGRADARVLWIDALCIWQEDVEERNQQVSMMGRIYKCASRVVVWLGDAEEPALHEIQLGAGCPAISSNTYTSWVARRQQVETLRRVVRHARPQWWTRCWVVQEAALAQTIEVCFGACSLPWQAFREIVDTTVQEDTVLDQELHTLSQMLRHVHTLSLAARTSPPTLLEALLSTKSCNSQDGRDRVYSLLSLVRQEDVALCPVDYSQATRTVFARATCAIINTSNDCSVLGLVKINRMIPSSSWGVDYANLGHWRWDHMPSRLFEPFRRLSNGNFLGRETKLKAVLSADAKSLVLSGRCIDVVHAVVSCRAGGFASIPTIFSVGLTWERPGVFLDSEDSAVRQMARRVKAPDLRSYFQATPCANGSTMLCGVQVAAESRMRPRQAPEPENGRGYDRVENRKLKCLFPLDISGLYPNLPSSQPPYRIWTAGRDECAFAVKDILYEMSKHGMDNDGLKACLEDDVLRLWLEYACWDVGEREKHVKFFTTKAGLIGLGTESVQPGDSLVVLPGPTTAVLRRRFDDEAYEFRGLAYVPSVALMREDEFERRNFIVD